jgi:hypothetical protein
MSLIAKRLKQQSALEAEMAQGDASFPFEKYMYSSCILPTKPKCRINAVLGNAGTRAMQVRGANA